MGFFSNLWNGIPEKQGQRSTLRKDQIPLSQQAVNAGMNSGAGGAFGTSADYYRDLLSDDSKTNQMMAAPELRRFNEQILPDIAEQYAGMGSGNLSSSGFQNSATSAGTDLSERLGAIRAQLRQQGAQGLQNIGQQGLQSFTENYTTPGQGGLGQFVGPTLGAVGTAIGGPVLGALGGAAGNMASNWLSQSSKGKSSPNGNKAGASGFNQVGAR